MSELSRILDRTVATSRNGNANLNEPLEVSNAIPTRSFYGENSRIRPKKKLNTAANQAQHTARNNSSSAQTSMHRRTLPKTTVNNIQRNIKQTNQTASNDVPRTSNSSRNSRKQKNSSRAGNDLDGLLAMHLAQDLNSYDDEDNNGFQAISSNSYAAEDFQSKYKT